MGSDQNTTYTMQIYHSIANASSLITYKCTTWAQQMLLVNKKSQKGARITIYLTRGEVYTTSTFFTPEGKSPTCA